LLKREQRLDFRAGIDGRLEANLDLICGNDDSPSELL
jgi:hypothetical protein